MDEVAALAIRAEASGVVGAAQLGLIFGVTVEGPQLMFPVSKSTLSAIPALASLVKGAAQLGFIQFWVGSSGITGLRF